MNGKFLTFFAIICLSIIIFTNMFLFRKIEGYRQNNNNNRQNNKKFESSSSSSLLKKRLKSKKMLNKKN